MNTHSKTLQQTLKRGTLAALLAGAAIFSSTQLSLAKGGGLPRVKGIVQARPAGKVGTWVIGGRSFTATRATRLDTLEGPLSVGACAKVRYRGANIAVEIDSEPATDC